MDVITEDNESHNPYFDKLCLYLKGIGVYLITELKFNRSLNVEKTHSVSLFKLRIRILLKDVL